MKCSIDTCVREETDWFFSVANWTCTDQKGFCGRHAVEYWKAQCISEDVRMDTRRLKRSDDDYYEFDLWMLARVNVNDQFIPCFRDKSGNRHLFWWGIHQYALPLLYNLLTQPEVADKLIYRFILNLASYLGGEVQSVSLRQFDLKEKRIQATASIRKGREVEDITILPEDALLLAITAKVPFRVSMEVLETHEKLWPVIVQLA